MSIQINYKKTISKSKVTNVIFFVDEKFNISALKKHISGPEYSYIYDLIKTKELKKKNTYFRFKF